MSRERNAFGVREFVFVAPAVGSIVVVEEHLKLVGTSVKKSVVANASGMMI